MTRHIRVSRNIRSYHWGTGHALYSGWRVWCRVCGHDAFTATHKKAMHRAQTMAKDHIPYSPDGALTCRDWHAGRGWKRPT